MSDPDPVMPSPAKVSSLMAQLRADAHDQAEINRKHNYYNAVNGELAVAVFSSWKDNKFKPFTIDCLPFRMAPKSMRLKLQSGLQWVVDNTEGATKEFWARLAARIRYKLAPCQLTVILRPEPETIAACVGNQNTNLKHELERWVASCPRVRTKWPHGGAHELSPADIEWFTNRLRQLELENYIGIVEHNELQFIKVAPGTLIN